MGAVALDSPKIARLGAALQVDPLGETFFSFTAFRHGDQITKYHLRPLTEAFTVLSGASVDTNGRPDGIREGIHKEMVSIDGQWASEAHLCRTLDKQPFEDPNVEWKVEDTPFIQIAILRIPHLNRWSDEAVHQVNEEKLFSV